MSGKPATFLAGGEFPIIVPGDDNRVTVEFKQFGVSLGFTPTLLGQNRISLYVNPEVSQLSNNGAVQLGGFSIPALTTRRAETTVELGNGQSFAIDGLLQNDIRHDIDKFPGLGDIPVLGTLFRSDRFQRNETELVIIVTPYVVRPTSGPTMAAPTDGLTPPTDEDRLLHGRLYRPTPRAGEQAPTAPGGTTTRGPIGFVLE
jgi:pilus assembly protein CpaC